MGHHKKEVRYKANKNGLKTWPHSVERWYAFVNIINENVYTKERGTVLYPRLQKVHKRMCIHRTRGKQFKLQAETSIHLRPNCIVELKESNNGSYFRRQ